MAALDDLVGNAANRQQLRFRAYIGDETAETGMAVDAAFVCELAQRPVRRHPACLEHLYQSRFSRNLVVHRP